MFDIIVVGAGPSGSATAFFLAKQGLNVLIVDKSKFPRDKTCGDALLPRALNILDKMHILPEIEPLGFKIKNLSFITGMDSITEAIPKHDGFLDFALVVQRYFLDEILLQQAQKAGATFEPDIHVEKIEVNFSNASLLVNTLTGRHEIKARLVVVATGANTGLLVKSKIIDKPRKLSFAIRAYYQNIAGFGENLEFYFSGMPLPGYAWVFPVSGNTANIGLGSLPRWWSAKMPATKTSFYEMANRNVLFKSKLEKSEMIGPLKSFPLMTNFGSSPTHAERILLVGEAAGLVNPLTGDGIDWALESGYLAAQIIPSLLSSSRKYSFYTEELRKHFQVRFKYAEFVRDVFLNKLFFARLFKLGFKEPEFRKLLVDLALFQIKSEEILSSKWLFRLLTT